MQIVRAGKLSRISLQSRKFSSELFEFSSHPVEDPLSIAVSLKLCSKQFHRIKIEHMVEIFLRRCPTISSPALQTASISVSWISYLTHFYIQVARQGWVSNNYLAK